MPSIAPGLKPCPLSACCNVSTSSPLSPCLRLSLCMAAPSLHGCLGLTFDLSASVKQTIGDSAGVSRTSGFFMWVGAHFRVEQCFNGLGHRQLPAADTEPRG